MSATRRARPRARHPRSYTTLLHKPRGAIHPRVQAVGPEHFAIIAVDPAKARSKWMMTDFYGNVLIQPTVPVHHSPGFRDAIAAINRQAKIRKIQDMIVVIEHTGKFHHPPRRAYAAAGFP